MSACFNSHALRQFENSEAEQERRAIEAEDTVLWQFAEDCRTDPGKVAQILSDYEIDLSPLLALVFKPVAHPDINTGRIAELRRVVNSCAHAYITTQIQKELEK